MTTVKGSSRSSGPRLETICRLCLQPDKGKINIFQSQLSIPVRIMACAALEVRNGDGLPSLICEKCRYQLEVSYYFRKKCQISDGKLRKHIRLLNSGKKSRVFLKSNDEDDEPDEEELQCEESIKFIEAEDMRNKAEEDEKKQKWLEEQREELRREDTQRLFEDFGIFMQSRMPVPKTMKRERVSPPSTSTSTLVNRRCTQKERLQEIQNVQTKTMSFAQPQHEQEQLQQEEQLQPDAEAEADNEITSSEQIPDEQEQDQEREQEQEQSMFYSDDGGDGENSEMLIFDGKSHNELDGDQEIIQIEGDEDAEMVETMSQEEEGITEDTVDENEIESKANNDTEEIDEFIFLADFEDSDNGVGQSERASEVESYQIEENGEIQYLKDERSQEDAINSNQLDNSSDSKYVIEDVTVLNVQKYGEKVPVKMDKKKKQRKVQIPIINKVVTLVNEKVSPDDLRIFKCNDCPQSFTRANSLLRHRSAHKAGREYCCDHCDKFFSCKSSLDRHIRIHTGEKPFTCEECGKNFMQKEILKRHLTIHTGERPHQCPHCPRSFVQKLLMRQHINAVHLAVPQITKNVCHLCPKSFLHPSGLSRHLLTHRGMVFSCPVCGRTFNDKSSLRRHFGAVHVKNEQVIVPKAEPDENESSNEYLLT